MGAGSLVLGIIGLIMAFIPTVTGTTRYIGAVLSLIGIILGVMGRKNPETQGLATGGMVCSIIAFVLCIITVIACTTACSILSSMGR